MTDRRTFIARAGAFLALFRPGWKALAQSLQAPRADSPASPGEEVWDYIVVGSGAGGGTVAARLAELGHKVLVLEAGGDPMELQGGNAAYPNENTMPADYQIPGFHPNATENEAMKWDFFVRHYSDTEQQKRDPKYRAEYNNVSVDGVLYPRAGTLGGCTAHNAMILVCPHNQDWQDIADEMHDPSWSADKMRGYFERLENCHHRGFDRFLHKVFGVNLPRHGFGGWLRTERALPIEALKDKQLRDEVVGALKAEFQDSHDKVHELFEDAVSGLDPNDYRLIQDNAEGVRYTPLTTSSHARTGTRERLLGIQKRYGKQRLGIEKDALATRVLFDENKRAVGVEYRKGRRLYRPYGTPGEQGETKTVRARREVILSGGAFNTPQLLMLSGIGPKAQLEKFGIPPVKILEGVGKNLQDRYEVGLVFQLRQNLLSLEGATFRAAQEDEPYEEWRTRGKGVYTSNGTILAVIHKSFPERPLPDLFMMGLTGNFQGYEPGYSKKFVDPAEHDKITWAVLKAHTENSRGEVTLASADPLVAPHINFHYFHEGSDQAGHDLESVVEGIKRIRALTRLLQSHQEVIPGKQFDTDDQLREYVKNHAWGHHASCTCRIGDENGGGVLDSGFQVHGVSGLRVVDASIFPKIPGFFIVSSIYIAAEKAADIIHASARTA